MDEHPQEQASSALIVLEDGKRLEKREVKQAAALLLTRAPMDTLSDEFDRISALGPHFDTLNMGVCHHLTVDPHANRLKTTLLKFNVPMDAAAEQLIIALASARAFYAHNREEILPTRDGYGQLTNERVATLLEQGFQEDAVKRAREVAEQVANAASIVRKVLPLLPQLKADLDDYVATYLGRVSARERRKKSWYRSMFDTLLGDPVAQTPWKPAKVKELPQHLSEGADLLRLLPAFLDNTELHFRRLSEIQTQQVIELGYTTPEDLTRLYQDRLTCISILRGMESMWTPALEAFGFGAMKRRPL